MSWIIQALLRSSVELRSESNINSDEFTDLMLLEKWIKDLHIANIISKEELELIHYVEDGKPMVNSKHDFGKNRISLARDFVNLCNKIAFYVGGYFTNDGYIDYMMVKYNLTDDEVARMVSYMTSKYKTKLLRKHKKTNE